VVAFSTEVRANANPACSGEEKLAGEVVEDAAGEIGEEFFFGAEFG
jgi:hypothetical protein